MSFSAIEFIKFCRFPQKNINAITTKTKVQNINYVATAKPTFFKRLDVFFFKKFRIAVFKFKFVFEDLSALKQGK